MERMSRKTAEQDRRNRSNTGKQLVNVIETSKRYSHVVALKEIQALLPPALSVNGRVCR